MPHPVLPISSRVRDGPVIDCDQKAELISAMEHLRDAPDQQSEILRALNAQPPEDEMWTYDVATLALGDSNWAIRAARETSKVGVDWTRRPEEIVKLRNGDLEALAAF